jgi:hypothetical protein
MCGIDTWKQFRRSVRASGEPLLAALPQFPDSILVTGCQRSGTTIVTRIIAGTEGISRFRFTKDDELDAALILSGRITGLPPGRYCFQTTYMYDSLHEYVEYVTRQNVVWVLRNPFSVVYSMLHNWKRSALNELFMGCGVSHLREPHRYRMQLFGVRAVPALRRACLSYRAKLDELFWLREALPESSLIVVDYDALVSSADEVLSLIYQRLGLRYAKHYGGELHGSSRSKADRLAAADRALIASLCLPAYERARTIVNVGVPAS